MKMCGNMTKQSVVEAGKKTLAHQFPWQKSDKEKNNQEERKRIDYRSNHVAKKK